MADKHGPSPPPRGYLCYRAAAPLVIDGRLNKPAWEAAPWTEDFVDIEGDARPRPPLRTRVKMLWDDRYFYIGSEMEEPHVWATLTEHDSVIFQDNDFEIFIDPDGDNHDYYEIEINALNTVWDLRLPKPYRDGGPALNEWEIPGLVSAAHIDGTLNDPRDVDRGWSVEMAIPWAVLGDFAGCAAPPAVGDQWRVNFSRVEWDVEIVEGGAYRKIAGRPEHNWVWSPQYVVDMHRPERWGYVQFADAPPAVFRADPSAPGRDRLMRVYYAQRAYKAERGDWAGDLRTLLGHDEPDIALRLTETGYEASIDYDGEDGALCRLFVREDSRLWSISA